MIKYNLQLFGGRGSAGGRSGGGGGSSRESEITVPKDIPRATDVIRARKEAAEAAGIHIINDDSLEVGRKYVLSEPIGNKSDPDGVTFQAATFIEYRGHGASRTPIFESENGHRFRFDTHYNNTYIYSN